jgi:LacI family gluconate utilization system Gnt-I transcriptional repressor
MTMPSSTVPRKPRPTRSGSVTLADIAARVGVSSITVSRAINTPHLVSDALRAKIAAAIDATGYLPNRAARALASARSDSIAVLVPSLSNTVFIDMLAGIDDVLQARGYRTLIGDTRYSGEREEQLLRAYLQHAPDGLLITGFDQSEPTRHLIAQSRLPVVHMMELGPGDGFSVGLQQFDAGHALTCHLLARGYQRIGFMGAQLDARVMQRLAGYRAALQEAGLAYPAGELLTETPSSIGLGAQLLAQLLRQAPDCDALFCCNDDLAQGVLFECQRRAIRVPQQLAVAGFNDLAASAWINPRLTTIATPRHAIGHASATLLLARIDGTALAPTQQDLGYTLVVREST